jgi:hypothetical protein
MKKNITRVHVTSLFSPMHQARSVFFFHGAFNNNAELLHLAPLFSGMTMHFVDIPHHGLSASDSTEACSIFDEVSSVVKMLRRSDQDLLVGVSMGALFAAHLQQTLGFRFILLGDPYLKFDEASPLFPRLENMLRRNVSSEQAVILKTFFGLTRSGSAGVVMSRTVDFSRIFRGGRGVIFAGGRSRHTGTPSLFYDEHLVDIEHSFLIYRCEDLGHNVFGEGKIERIRHLVEKELVAYAKESV